MEPAVIDPKPVVLSRVEDLGADVAMIVGLLGAHFLRCNDVVPEHHDEQRNIDGRL